MLSGRYYTAKAEEEKGKKGEDNGYHFRNGWFLVAISSAKAIKSVSLDAMMSHFAIGTARKEKNNDNIDKGAVTCSFFRSATWPSIG